MNCLSCQANIDPKWKHAIDNNVCPFCGEVILPEDLKGYISNLSETISSFKKNYPSQLDDWMLSNYNYVRTDGDKIKQFFPDQKIIYRSSKGDISDEENDGVISIQDSEITSKFFKNAGASSSVNKTEELKKIVSEIKSKHPHITPHSSQDEDYFSQDDHGEVASSLGNDYDDEIPAAVLAFSNQKNKNSHDYNAKDMLRLQQLQEKTRGARENVINGTGGKGSFSRG